MPTFKTVWVFSESNGSTFSEVWYKEGSGGSPTSVVDPASPSVFTRLTFLHKLNTLVRIRVSQVGQQRNTLNVLINKAGTSPQTGGPAPAGDAVVVNVAGLNGGSRKWWMRGNALGDFARDNISGVDAPPAGLTNQIKGHMINLNADGYGILRLTPINNPATQIFKVTIADGSLVMGQTVLTAPGGPVVQLGATVILSKFSPKDLPRLNGKFTVLAFTGTTVTIAYTTPGNAKVNTLTGSLKVQAYDPTHVVDPARSGFDHFGTRSTKSPLFGSRGAKRAQRIRGLA